MNVARQTINMFNEVRARDRLFYRGKANLRQNHRQVDESLDVSADKDQSSEATSSKTKIRRKDSLAEPDIENQRLHICQRRIIPKQWRFRRTVSNKKFKCVECHYRSNGPRFVKMHFKLTHRQAVFNRQQCIQVLDEDEATRTLADYEKKYFNKNLVSKPFECGICEYRATTKGNAHDHMLQIHQVALNEAKRLVKVLPSDEANKTVDEYNKKIACKTGLYYTKLRLERKDETKSAAKNKQATAQSGQTTVNRKFKCVECFFRSNRPMFVKKHFEMTHKQLTFNNQQSIQVLDDDEALQTLADYEIKYLRKEVVCKPYKCGICEYRSSQKSNARNHICRVHRVESHQALTLVKVLSLDEAEQTVGEYNEKFGPKSGSVRSYI
jgi:hypothetical protein